MIIRILFKTFGGGGGVLISGGLVIGCIFLFTGRQLPYSLLFYTDQLSGHHAYSLNYISFFAYS